ncbi:MAG: proline--tRNA ligase [Spirochaetota bacterium]
MAGTTGITPTRGEDFAEWYQEVIKNARMAENSPVRGCMVILPWGYELWENIKQTLDSQFKATGHRNAYFPLFIPLSYLEKEAEHVEGFAKECAVVTHHRLEQGPDGGLVPAGELQEPLIVRPTSETIIGATFANWVQSYRDLPLLINQWANVVRWEMRTRLFLRTAEFLWQEGHTAHETKQDAQEETLRILELYRRFAHEYMAIPVIAGEKSESERFPGAVATYSIEAMMQDKKALQAGTSHFLGQNFSKASGIQYQSREGQLEYAWTTSWGVSTRLIGALIMTHGDDDGMIMPPRIAPAHIALLPIIRKEEDRAQVMRYVDALADELRSTHYDGAPIRVEVDDRDMNAGERSWDWVRKGIPLRAEIGPRDIEKNAVFLARRDKPPKDKTSVGRDELVSSAPGLLAEIQKSLYDRALAFRDENTRRIDSKDEFYEFFKGEGGGFAVAHWNGSSEIEEQIKSDLAVTVRAMPNGPEYEEAGTCPFSGEPSSRRVVFAKSY